MVATILEPEISTLESQVAALEAQIALAQSRIAALGEADVVASGALQALQEAVAKISGLAPGAIATLKAAALSLFQGGDDSNTGNGNQPITPTPSPNGNGHSHKTDVILGVDIVEISSQPLEEQLIAAITPESVALEPSESLQEQSVEIACTVPEVEQEQPYIELVKLTDAVAYQKKHNGEIPTAYVGLKSKTRGEAWGNTVRISVRQC